MYKKILLVMGMLVISAFLKGEAVSASPFVSAGAIFWNEYSSVPGGEFQIGVELNLNRFIASACYCGTPTSMMQKWDESHITTADAEGVELIVGYNLLRKKTAKVKVNVGCGMGVARTLQWLRPADSQKKGLAEFIYSGWGSYFPVRVWLAKEIIRNVDIMIGVEKKISEDKDYSFLFLGVKL